jgi:hypothetical protein
MAEPPITRVDDDVANRPGFLIDENPLRVRYVAIGCVNVVSHHLIAATQLRIIMVMMCCGRTGIGWMARTVFSESLGIGQAALRHIRIQACSPKTSASPIILIAGSKVKSS